MPRAGRARSHEQQASEQEQSPPLTLSLPLPQAHARQGSGSPAVGSHPPCPPTSFLPFSCEASATMCLTLSSQKTSTHILGRETLPKPGWSYLPPAEMDRAGLAAAGKLPSPVLGSGAHGRCGDPSAWLNPIPSSSISHPPLSAVRDFPGSTGLLGESSVKTRLF